MDDQKLTREQLEALRQEYIRLVTQERTAIADRLKAARARGDLANNAEYHQAVEAQRALEKRIREIETILDALETGGTDGE